jgi:ubiquinone/menaquinone biosynthesis C-methylase UbiE
MYKLFKKIYRKLIPNKFHYEIEPYIRNTIYYLIYKGETVQCNICLSKSKKFIPISFKNSKDKICPKCGSLSRSRALSFYVSKYFQNLKMNILDFSPHRSLYNFFNEKFPNYISSDYENQFFAQKKYDITKIDENNQSFHLIICFHVLEHVLDDEKAITELYRVLKKNGILIIQVPLKPGKTYEDLNLTSKNERLEAFGQEDHVRIYGQKSLKEKLKKFKFNVEIIDISKNFSETEKKIYGISEKEIIFKCLK